MTNQTYSTVAIFCKNHTAFKPGGVRSWIFNEETNGLKESGAVVRVGRKVLINDSLFFDWIESQNQGSKPVDVMNKYRRVVKSTEYSNVESTPKCNPSPHAASCNSSAKIPYELNIRKPDE
jgi:hypothetical protein